MLSSVLTKHWPAWHQKRGGRRLTAKMKHTKVEEEQIKSITSSTALNIGQSTFLSCKFFISSYLEEQMQVPFTHAIDAALHVLYVV